LTTSNTWSGLRLLAFPACAQGKINEKAKIRMECLLILERDGFLEGGRFKGRHRKFGSVGWQLEFVYGTDGTDAANTHHRPAFQLNGVQGPTRQGERSAQVFRAAVAHAAVLSA